MTYKAVTLSTLSLWMESTAFIVYGEERKDASLAF